MLMGVGSVPGAGVFEGVECADSGGGADDVFVGGWIAGTPPCHCHCPCPCVFSGGGGVSWG